MRCSLDLPLILVLAACSGTVPRASMPPELVGDWYGSYPLNHVELQLRNDASFLLDTEALDPGSEKHAGSWSVDGPRVVLRFPPSGVTRHLQRQGDALVLEGPYQGAGAVLHRR